MLDQVQSAARVATLVINILVVHDAPEVTARRIDRGQLLRPLVQLEQDILQQVLRILSMSRQAVGEPVHRLELRPDSG